ncbi:hypothetical protein ACTA71_006578 [Dictyostelium dimigraforme]
MEVQDLLQDDAIEQVLPNRYSKIVFYSNVFTVPKPGTTLLRPVLDLKRLNSYIVNQSFKMRGIKNLPSMLKKGYYMVKLYIKKAYLHFLVDPQFRDLFRFVWKGVHYRSSGSSNSTNDFYYRMKAMEEQINKLTSTFTRFMKEPVNIHSDSQETIKDKNETSDIPSEYMLSDSLLEQCKGLINNQGPLDEEVCILKRMKSPI